MKIDPSEIEIPKFRLSLKGYNHREVDEFIMRLREDYQEIVHQNNVLTEEINELKEQIKGYTSKKERLEDALISAQKSAQLISENSQEQAKLIVKEAEIKAKTILEEGEKKLQELRNEIASLSEQKRLFLTKLKSLITSHSELLNFYEEELPEKEAKVKKETFKDDELPFKERIDERNAESISLENDHDETITFEDG
ncbi:DivIVA domain-containing protein [Candidatus Aerophobetes bacterium]|uniref:DivIVA domain-containing protein n=1 Tax=Aerophobetes bacterium TaxID=2030807 RepID=A0A523WBR4_UNCAE|nr:MAG: DivIVA domain-containing protein [Candidatus Aerophobetes bacterium]